MEQEDFKKVATLDNEIEAQLLDSILIERHIPHRMRSFYDTAFDGLFQVQKGWGYVGAPESYHREILEIISHMKNQTTTIDKTADNNTIN